MPQPLLGHLIELRMRLIYCLVALGLGAGISYPFSSDIFHLLTQPFWEAGGKRMIYTGLTEAFLTYLKITVVSGSVLALPVILWQGWLFMRPGLHAHERRVLWLIVIASPLLFLLGAGMAYFIVCPLAWKFFLSFETPSLHLEARMSEYLSLILKLITAFGICFQLPLVILGLFKMGFLSLQTLTSKRKYAFLSIVIVAAVLTPPDMISPLLLIIPLYGLYELSVGVIYWTQPKEGMLSLGNPRP